VAQGYGDYTTNDGTIVEGYNTPEQGTLDWYVLLNQTFGRLETDLKILLC